MRKPGDTIKKAHGIHVLSVFGLLFLLGVVHRPLFADHGDLYLARIGHFRLDPGRKIE